MQGDVSQAIGFLSAITNDLVGAHPSWDVLLLVGGVALVVFMGFFGRPKLVSIAIAVYAAIALLATTSLYDWVFSAWHVPFTPLAVIVIVLLVTAILFFMIDFGLNDVLSDDHGLLASSVILAAAIVGLLASYTLTVLPPDILQGFSALTQALFAGDVARVLWLIAPIIIIGATRD